MQRGRERTFGVPSLILRETSRWGPVSSDKLEETKRNRQGKPMENADIVDDADEGALMEEE